MLVKVHLNLEISLHSFSIIPRYDRYTPGSECLKLFLSISPRYWGWKKSLSALQLQKNNIPITTVESTLGVLFFQKI